MNAEQLPMSLILAKMYMDANQTVHSGVPTRTLEKVTHLNHTTISRIRSNKRSLDDTTLRTCLHLSAYPKSKANFDTDRLWSIFEQVIGCGIPIAPLSKKLSISRITLIRLRDHKAKLLNTNIHVTVTLVDFYDNYVAKNKQSVASK